MTDQEINEAAARKLGYDTKNNDLPPRPYCRRIEAAWEIVEWLDGQTKRYFELKKSTDKLWRCEIGENLEGTFADSAPMAICLAFLKLP